ncbi:MAG: aminotransferase class V-fold PLP-dependent enzyme [Balneolaceae bacterium]|nr:aminotransferase class V-fold PLP-dependent enzyme [Balneolaceae bacterium]
MNKTSTPSDDKPAIERWRADTPGCAHRNHLNNAGAALMPGPVIDAVTDYLQEESLYGGYETADARAEQIEAVYESLARLIGAKPSNIAVVENATVATSQALSAFDFEAGDTVLTTRVDYSSNQIMLLNLAQRFGVRVIRAEDKPGGGVDPDSVQSLIREHRPRLMLMSWVPTNSGLVQEAAAVGEICRAAELPFLLDACQAVGQMPVDVSDLNCDFLAATSRKFLRGPRGLGFLFVADRVLENGLHPLFPDTHGAQWISADRFRLEESARRFENWEFPYALVAGLGMAADYALKVGLDTIQSRCGELAAYARQQLGELPGARLLDRGAKRCAIVTVSFDGVDATSLVKPLREIDINTSANRRHHAVIDMDEKQTETNLRVSPHYYNTQEEINALVHALERML